MGMSRDLYVQSITGELERTGRLMEEYKPGHPRRHHLQRKARELKLMLSKMGVNTEKEVNV